MPSDGPQRNMHLMNPQPDQAASSEQPSTASTDGHRALLDRHSSVLSRIAAGARACARIPDAIDLLAVNLYPFKQATACSAHTGIEHCGSWNYQPKLWLNQRLKQQKKALSKISIGRMECAFFESSEGFQEYWIAFHHKNYQAGCQ
jgi:hypothetical protein